MKIVKTDMVGKRFGSLKVLDSYEQRGNTPYRKTYWLCECECGNQMWVESNSLKRRVVKYCRQCRPSGRRNTKLYHIYHGMKQRCNNSNNPNYSKYGSVGITICPEWESGYSLFEEWANSNGYIPGLTIDRIDSSKGYGPDNCRWISLSENSARANIGRNKNVSKLTSMYATSEMYGRVNISNIYKFAIKYNLNYQNVVAALHGRIKYSSSGWKFYSNLINNNESVTTIETIPMEKDHRE